MRILFLGLSLPKLEKSTYMYTGLVREINRQGHDLLVIAPAYDKNITGLQEEMGVNVIRVPTFKLFRVGIIQKGLANLMLPVQYKKWLKKYNIKKDFDLVILPTPPITLYGLVKWFKKSATPKVYLILRDIFPQNAVDLGIMKKNGLIHWYFRKKEKNLYRIADKIGCMSEGNIEYIKRHNPEILLSKMHILANWADMVPLKEKSTLESFKEREGIVGKFVVVFGGNIGLPQKMENIVELAKACRDQEDIVFIIYGYGSEIDTLKQLVDKAALSNIKLRNGLPQKEFINLLQFADVGLISLSENFTIPNIPSKALSYYNARVPILASIDLNTDFGKILEKYKTGFWAEAGNTADLKVKLMMLYKDADLRREMGNNGYNYMKEELSCKKAYQILISEIAK